MDNSIDIFSIPINEAAADIINSMNDGVHVFEETSSVTPVSLPGTKDKNLRGYVPWGNSNITPLEVVRKIRKDEVLSSNLQFNIFAGYGNGLSTKTKAGGEITDQAVVDFFKYNRAVKYLLEQQTDIKNLYFSICVLILSGDGTKIVRLVHKDAVNCRFETCNPDTGAIEHVFFGDWETAGFSNFEVIELLDTMNPLADLMVRMGKLPDDDGKTKTTTKTRKFAMLNEVPTIGNNYYSFAPFWSIFNSGWYDIKQMIPAGKKAKFTNGMVINFQVEINKEYWKFLNESENITDPAKQIERQKKEKDNIREFLTGIANSGKIWFSGFYIHPVTGQEVKMVKITMVDTSKQGGDWIQDTAEASSMECYATGTNTDLVGSPPGQSKGGLSGSDKRELFTIKQALEKPIRDILLEPYFVIKEYNQWDLEVEIPFVILTTLDKKTDAVPASASGDVPAE